MGPADIIKNTKVWNSYWWTIFCQRRKKEDWVYIWHVESCSSSSSKLNKTVTFYMISHTGVSKCFHRQGFTHLSWEAAHNYIVLIWKKYLFPLSWCVVKMFFFLYLDLFIIVLFLCTMLNNSLCYLNLSKMSRWLLCSLPSLSFYQGMHILYPLFSLIRFFYFVNYFNCSSLNSSPPRLFSNLKWLDALILVNCSEILTFINPFNPHNSSMRPSLAF